MAHKTLPALSLDHFPQVVSNALRYQVEQVCRLTDEASLSHCTYEYVDAECGRTATVFFLESEQHLCAKHFREVNRG